MAYMQVVDVKWVCPWCGLQVKVRRLIEAMVPPTRREAVACTDTAGHDWRVEREPYQPLDEGKKERWRRGRT